MSLETEENEWEDDSPQWLERPYFMWSIEDIFSVKRWVRSPIFTVSGVQFTMRYSTNSDMCIIRILPVAEDRKSGVDYHFDSSISVTFSCDTLAHTYFTYKERINKGKEYNRIVFMVEQIKLYNLIQELEGGNKKVAVTFLCVFGPLAKRQEDATYSEGTWCENHCLNRLVDDIGTVRRDILLKCGIYYGVQSHKDILSARSEKFADMFRNMKAAEKEIDMSDMKYDVLYNFVWYIHSGRLAECWPSEDLLIQLYEAAVEYRIYSLQIMSCCRLVEIYDDTLLTGAMDAAGNFNKEVSTLRRKLMDIAEKHDDDVFKEKINFCQMKWYFASDRYK